MSHFSLILNINFIPFESFRQLKIGPKTEFTVKSLIIKTTVFIRNDMFRLSVSEKLQQS